MVDQLRTPVTVSNIRYCKKTFRLYIIYKGLISYKDPNQSFICPVQTLHGFLNKEQVFILFFLLFIRPPVTFKINFNCKLLTSVTLKFNFVFSFSIGEYLFAYRPVPTPRQLSEQEQYFIHCFLIRVAFLVTTKVYFDSIRLSSPPKL